MIRAWPSGKVPPAMKAISISCERIGVSALIGGLRPALRLSCVRRQARESVILVFGCKPQQPFGMFFNTNIKVVSCFSFLKGRLATGVREGGCATCEMGRGYENNVLD